MRWLGVVVLYFPKDNVAEYIASYLPHLDGLIIWNNTPNSTTEKLREALTTFSSKIIFKGENTNLGMGKALNEAAYYAEQNHYNYLLTMDQDSFFEETHFALYKKWVESYTELSIYSPNYKLKERLLYPSFTEVVEQDSPMTSGSVYPVKIFQRIGLFREDFFIDIIEAEYVLRALKEGILSHSNTSIVLHHGWGYCSYKRIPLLGIRVKLNNYSPMRTYYILRNGLIAKRIFPDSKYWKDFFVYYLYKRILFVLLFETRKYAKLKAITQGVWDGLRGKTGGRFA